VDPAGQAYPAEQLRVQDVPAAALLYRPAGHRVHAAADEAENCPGPHGTAVELVDPAGQEYPACGREAGGATSPHTSNIKKRGCNVQGDSGGRGRVRTKHGPLHKNDVMAEELPKRPARHGEHDDAALTLYCPGGHGPVQDDEFMAGVAPKLHGGGARSAHAGKAGGSNVAQNRGYRGAGGECECE
jgi:hypothetical protein